jgi:hypothetical protein
MFEEAGCPWCIRWHSEVGAGYPRSDEGRRAPLRLVEIHASRPADLAFVKGVRASPTFVLVDRGREIGRITGYPGADFFWGLLAPMIAQLPADGLAADGMAAGATGCPSASRTVSDRSSPC